MATPEIRTHVVDPVARNLEARASELGQALVERFQRELPELYRDDGAVQSHLASNVAGLRAIAALLLDDLDPSQIELAPETIAHARDGARQGLPASSLLRTYRIGHEALWDIIVRGLSEHARTSAELAAAVTYCAVKLFGYVDAAVLQGEDVYAAERERFARSSAAQRAETIAAILAGRLTDASVAGQRLRHDLDRTHVGVWAWLTRPPERGDLYTLLEAAIAELAGAAGLGAPLAQPQGTHAVAGWISGVGVLDVERLAATRLDPQSFPDVMLAVGEPAAGIDGFRVTHDQASAARRVATLTRRHPGQVTRYARVELQAMVSSELDQVRAFVHRELGPLAATDDTALRLAATLRAYLDEHASRSRAATRLGVHENTIRYRIRQIEEILGRSVEENTLNLRMALAVAPLVPDRV